jgi:hypothetical protein
MVFFKVPDRENEGKRGVCVDSIVCGKGIHLESSEWGWIWTFHGMKQTSKKTREARMRSSSQSRWMDGCNGFNLRLRVTTTTELPMTDATDRQTDRQSADYVACRRGTANRFKTASQSSRDVLEYTAN